MAHRLRHTYHPPLSNLSSRGKLDIPALYSVHDSDTAFNDQLDDSRSLFCFFFYTAFVVEVDLLPSLKIPILRFIATDKGIWDMGNAIVM